MKFPKVLIPFLAILLPSMRFEKEEINTNLVVNKALNNFEEFTRDETAENRIILRKFSDSDRFLQFVKHSSHSSHRSHSSHSSHRSHSSHTSHYSGSTSSSDCSGCEFDVENVDVQDYYETKNNILDIENISSYTMNVGDTKILADKIGTYTVFYEVISEDGVLYYDGESITAVSEGIAILKATDINNTSHNWQCYITVNETERKIENIEFIVSNKI